MYEVYVWWYISMYLDINKCIHANRRAFLTWPNFFYVILCMYVCRAVEISIMFNCLYLAFWATNFITISSKVHQDFVLQICTQVFMWVSELYVCMYVCVYVCMYYVCMLRKNRFGHINTYIHTHTYIHTYIYTPIQVYTYIHTYIHSAYIHTYIHTYIHSAYIHTYIQMFFKSCLFTYLIFVCMCSCMYVCMSV